ncbi:acyltransferase family protein [Polaromonas sp. YR568]|uniref:acyltransferase family protein n=1 Tax=Polaromonas sp. YR568 TaxID=1855301 RepID=UPI003137F5C4
MTNPSVASATPDRLAGIDVLKGIACALIVWHHLAFYGPMSDVVFPFAPQLMDWLYDYARMAVQLFLVVGGFLAAGSLAPRGMATVRTPWRLLLRRYRRLVLPYLAALAVSLLVAAVLRPWFVHDSLPAAPTLWQVLSHALLLHSLVGQESLSAGVWYVAIDFQLFALSVLLFSLTQAIQRGGAGAWSAAAGLALIGAMVVASLMVFNRQPGLDATALYFFGAYGLGMVARWAVSAHQHGQSERFRWLLLAMALAVIAALWLDFRGRIVVAAATAFGLVGLQLAGEQLRALPPQWMVQPLARLGGVSYSVFLIHFPVCLLVNAVVSHFWPAVVWINAVGLLAAFGLSLASGVLLYRSTEARTLRPSPS